MTLEEFISKYSGQKNVGNTPENRGECVGVSSLWMDNFDIPHVWGHATDLYKNASTKDFTKIPNTPDAIVQKGDIVVWGKGYNGTFGHTGVATGTNTDVNRFDCFQQNDPLGSTPHIKNYNYAYVIGWLRPKRAVIAQPIAQQPQFTDQTKIPLNLKTAEETYGEVELGTLRAKLIAKDQTIKDAEKLAEDLTEFKKTLFEPQTELGKLLYVAAKKFG